MNEAASAGRAHRPPAAAAPVFRGRYLSITSYKRDGRGVATPVWFACRDGKLLVETDAASGKVKRVRRNPQVGAVERLITDKYRFDMIIFRPLRFIQANLHLGRPRTSPAILSITPSDGLPDPRPRAKTPATRR